MTLSLELRQPQLNNESAVQPTSTWVTKLQKHFGSKQSPCSARENQQLVQEGEAQIKVARHEVESEQQASVDDSRISLTGM